MKQRPILLQMNQQIRGYNFVNSFQGNCKELVVSYDKFYDIYYIFASANFNLEKAANKDLDISELNTTNDDIFRNFIRGEHLKYTILTYRSIEDYIMQVVMFGFKLKNIGKSKNGFRYKSKNNYYKDTMDELEKYNKKNKNKLRNLEKILKDFNGNTNYSKYIVNIANGIKHGNTIRFKDLPRQYFMKHEGKSFSTSWIEADYYSIDELVDICYKFNPIIKKYVEDIYNELIKQYPKYNIPTIE